MKTRILIIFLILVSIVFQACNKDENKDCIDGNNDLVISTRQPGNFDQVIANGAYNINFSPAAESRIDLFGDSNILPVIETYLNGSTLIIEVQDGQCYNATQTIEATLTAPEIRKVTLNGAGTITGNGLSQDELEYVINGAATIVSSFNVESHATTINGSGDATLAGEAVNATFTITGTGNILGTTLETVNCNVVISGSGDVRITVSDQLNVTISGSGNVYYNGDPTIVSNITGTGQVIKGG